MYNGEVKWEKLWLIKLKLITGLDHQSAEWQPSTLPSRCPDLHEYRFKRAIHLCQAEKFNNVVVFNVVLKEGGDTL